MDGVKPFHLYQRKRATMSKNDLLLSLWKEYEIAHDYSPTGTRPVVEWALSEGRLELPEVDPVNILASQMAQALRTETAIDEKGREYRVNHAVKITKDGVQTTFWGIMGFASREHMEKSFTQRREQIISDCVHLRIDVDAYNAKHPKEKPVQLELNFSEDVAERLVYQDAA
jgi:hypothetical protein